MAKTTSKAAGEIDFFDDLIPAPARLAPEPGAEAAPRRIRLELQLPAGGPRADLQRLCAIVLQPWLTARGPAARLVIRLIPGYCVPGAPRQPPALAGEAYELAIGRTLVLTASTAAGLRLGIQTVKQALENAAQRGRLPHGRIRDWPRIGMRGIHVDLAREMEYRPAHLRRIVERLAYFRMNTLHLYLENKFVYPSAPEVAPPRVMTPAQAGELCAYARLFGITIIPQIPTMGHMEHLLNGPYAGLREDPARAFNLCPTHPRSRPFLAGLIADVAAAFRPPFIHAGYDESHSGVCARCQKHGSPQQLLADHLNWLNTEIKKHGARTMIYGDKFLSPEDFPRADAVNGGAAAQAREALRGVSRDILITDWHYTTPYDNTTAYLVKQGFEVHGVSASNIYWHDAIPLHRGQHWIVPTLDRMIAAGATGAFNSNWEYYRGQFLDNFWHFQALAAERMWSARPHDYVAWGPRFSRRFWGVDGDSYSELAGLSETIRTERRTAFLDNDVLDVNVPSYWRGWSQLCCDYRELGAHLIAQARRLETAAVRNRDTLRLLDMPGQIVRYLGARAEARQALERALPKGDKRAVLTALRGIRAAARAVAARLDVGYRVYGGAGVDRKRLAGHLLALAAYERWARRAGAGQFRRMTVDKLIAERKKS